MSADVDHDVTVDDFFGNNREYYVTGYYKVVLTVHTPEGHSIDLDGYFDSVTDAEDFINEHNREFCDQQEYEENERIEREEAEEQEQERLDRIAEEEEDAIHKSEEECI